VLIAQLPVIPRLSEVPRGAFRRVILCFVVYRTKYRGSTYISQREIASRFNRSGRQPISKHLLELRKSGLLQKLTESSGTMPDEYGRGEFFNTRTRESDRLCQMTNALFGERGILRRWTYVSAWGYGCIDVSGVLCLATLSVLDEPISKSSLTSYLAPIVSVSSIERCVDKFVELGLIHKSTCGLATTSDWRQKFEAFLDSTPACNERKTKGDNRRRNESAQNAEAVRRGIFTDAEKSQYKRLPCVCCGGKSDQREHFPPKKYLKQLPVYNNRNLVWSICRKCNRSMAEFIKQLPDIPLQKLDEMYLSRKEDPLVIYRMVANYHLKRFYEAFERGDNEAAVTSIRRVLSLWYTLWHTLRTDERRRVNAPVQPLKRDTIRRAGSTFESQLPLRTDPVIEKRRRTNRRFVRRVRICDRFTYLDNRPTPI